jgi:hypothetical protein
MGERMKPEMPDDLDRLFAKMEWDNPRSNFAARVIQRAHGVQRIQRASSILSLAALAVLGVFAFALGRGLTLSGTLDYLAVLATNLDVAIEATDDFVLALLAVAPWLEIAAVVLGALMLWLTSIVLPRVWSNRQSKSS